MRLKKKKKWLTFLRKLFFIWYYCYICLLFCILFYLWNNNKSLRLIKSNNGFYKSSTYIIYWKLFLTGLLVTCAIWNTSFGLLNNKGIIGTWNYHKIRIYDLWFMIKTIIYNEIMKYINPIKDSTIIHGRKSFFFFSSFAYVCLREI